MKKIRWPLEYLDIISYGLIVAALFAWGIRSGSIIFSPAFSFLINQTSGITAIFSFLLLCSICLFFCSSFLVRHFEKNTTDTVGMRALRLVLCSGIIALAIDVFVRAFFITPGSFALGEERGIWGSFSNIWIDWIVWLIMVWIGRGLHNVKQRLRLQPSASLLFFVIALIISFCALYL